MSWDEVAHSIATAVAEMIDADLRALGVTEKNAGEYEIIWQSDGSTASIYRGIARKGKLVWDKHPDWPKVQL
jgi:hypothetical protein